MIQAKMADMYTTLNASRSYVYNVARALDRGERQPNVCTKIYDMRFCVQDSCFGMNFSTFQVCKAKLYSIVKIHTFIHACVCFTIFFIVSVDV